MTDNVNRGLRMFCGNKQQLPPQTFRGTPFQCFKKGIGVGIGLQKTEEQNIRRQERQRTEAISYVLLRRKMARDIESKGINVLKRDLRLSALQDKDLVRSVARKLTGTTQSITGYSGMSQEQLINELVARGFQR